MSSDKYLRRKEAAAYLKGTIGVGSVALLAQAAMKGTGPAMVYFGSTPVYSPEALDDWAKSRLSDPVHKSKPRPRRSEDTPEVAAE